MVARLSRSGEGTASRVELRHQVLLLGPDAAGSRLRTELRALGIKRVALLASATAAAMGLVDEVRSRALTEVTLTDEITGVQRGAPAADVEALGDRLAADPPDALIAIGGGSVIDAAKAASVALSSRSGLAAFFQSNPKARPVPETRLAVVALPTTLSGAEVTASAGVTDANGVKRLIRGRPLAARIAVADPALLRFTPRSLLAETGMMALSHALESLYAPEPNPVSIATGLMGVELIGKGFASFQEGSARNAESDQGLADLGAGSILAGLAIGNARSGLQHAICHTLGAGDFGLSQAQAHAIMLPSVMRFNLPATEDAQRRFVECLGWTPGTGLDPAGFVASFRDRIGAPSSLRAFGISQADFAAVAARTITSPGAIENPRKISNADELVTILEAAW